MRYRAVVAATAVCAIGAVLGTGMPAGAQEEEPPPIDVSPTSGPPGSFVTVTGGGCESPAGAGAYMRDEAGMLVTEEFASEPIDGTWTADLQVPETALPGAVFEVRAWCEYGPGDNWEYAPVDFLVTEPRPDVIPIAVDPTSGPIGTTISVSGTDCTGDTVEFALLAGTSLEDFTHIVDAWTTEPAEDGSWSDELLVYETMFSALDDTEVPVVPGADYFVIAGCAFYPDDDDEAPPDEIIFSEAVDFEITGDGTAPPRPEPPAAPSLIDPPGAPARPATPVSGDPDYTG